MAQHPSPISTLRALLVLACTVLGGCATGPHTDRAQLAAPAVVSEVYSVAQLRLMLATTPDAQGSCGEADCIGRMEFDHRVERTGAKLVAAAYRAYPDLAARIPRFEFSVLDKTEPGTASTAGGKIVVLRPVSSIVQGEDALSFVLGREIGHVVAQHHDENTATSLVVSVLATVLAPIVNVAKLLAAAFSSGTTSAAASSSVTAASFVSSRMLIDSYRPRQREEADAIAINLLSASGYDARAAAAAFAGADLNSPPTTWMRDLRASVERLVALTDLPETPEPGKYASLTR